MTRLCFADTETSSLAPNRRAWDVALIIRDPGRPDFERQWFVEVVDLDLAKADYKSLEIGRFYQRHPQATGTSYTKEVEATNGRCGTVVREAEMAREVEEFTRGAVLIGAVPSFDADVLGQRLRANGLLPSWHYRPLCVETLALGWIAGLRAAGGGENGRSADLPTLPWRSSDELWLALGVDPADEAGRHTALGDARAVRNLFDVATDDYYRTAVNA